MTKKSHSGRSVWLTIVALAGVLGLAGGCALNTAPNTIPETQEENEKNPPKIGLLMPPGQGTGMLV